MRNPLNPRGPYRRRPIAERFWAKVDTSGECWTWQGSRSAYGYGFFHLDGSTVHAHRVAWSLRNGSPIPSDIAVLHRCDNPPCVNPAHLFLGTKADNSADMARKGRSGRTKLSAQAVADIRKGLEGQRQLAKKYGVSKTAIAYVQHGLTHRHHVTEKSSA